ncbi:MAG: adenine nucleotide alpha hydrolase [Minwuia sp.]|uniref:adenine nucleotide alpha hydrolase n=1 Tax=Minwuia sp. TaxID=2493630 RepID=UPI003A8B540D
MPDTARPDTGADAEARLLAALAAHDGLTVAVSGGIDSMVLAFAAHRSGRLPVRMVHAVSPAVPPAATERVRAYAGREGWDLHVVEAGEFGDPDYLKNPVNRCYFCKSNLYDRLGGLALGTVASGANTDDLGDYRPGLDAAAERDVVHPYVEAGIGKAGIRALARRYGLTDIAELPAQPCLASRVETGIAIDAADLAFIDRIETRLRSRFGETRTIRCRITAAGVAVEADESLSPDHAEMADLIRGDCEAEGRRFLGVRPYRRGSAFLHGTGGA